MVILLLVIPVIGSSDWVEYGRNKDGSIGLYKKVSIKNNIVRVWDKTVYSEKGRKKIIQSLKEQGLLTKEGNKISVITYLEEIDCKEQRIRVLSVIWNDKGGKVLFSLDYNDSEWNYVVPDSQQYILGDNVCK